MHEPSLPPAPEELGYFYDTIHGRIALEELPDRFRSALKAALSSKSISRLKRISQLGHTSLSFFSATHTRFSHAIGTMLVMNDLFAQVEAHGLSPQVFAEIREHYADVVATFDDERNMVHCHLLLAALYQDTGELPFQKVSSSHFAPVEQDVSQLVNALPHAKPRRWSGKKVLSLLSLWNDFRDPEIKGGFDGYSLEFLAYLIAGDGAPQGAHAIAALLQMVDGVLDADRLDYVYRDASVTIGSLSRPSTVLESVVAYEPGRVIVNDARPVADLLSTRMRLWTFVYSSADVRFRQALLKTVLDGLWDSERAEKAFEACDLDPELPYDKFLKLDDISLMDRIERLPSSPLRPCRRQAQLLLLRGTLDYECRVLRRTGDVSTAAASKEADELPADMFFDLLWDHGHHQLYRADSVFVRQRLTSRISDAVRLEEGAGAFSPLFTAGNSAILVRDGYYVFLPRERHGGHWPQVEPAIADGTLHSWVKMENARRGVPPTDTRNASGFGLQKAVCISYCSSDFPLVVRIVRELHRRKRRYRLFLRPFDGTGETPAKNSQDLVTSADAVIAVVSCEYLRRATDGNNLISIEVRQMHDRARDIPVVAVGVDPRSALDAVPRWAWAQMNEDWGRDAVVVSEDLPLREASEDVLRLAIDEALRAIDAWRSS
jgi:HD superfamily phosphohydrolase